jgi:putative PIN family toxin of toxin-antitoxin system
MQFGNRVVLDTSTLVGAVLRPNSIPRQAFIKPLSKDELCASQSTLAELEEVICRDKFDSYLNLSARHEFVAMYRDRVRQFQVSKEQEAALSQPCRDPRENKFLALVIACTAIILVTSDQDLLTMNPYGEVQILTPKEYLEN